jgi:hypothetical protein
MDEKTEKIIHGNRKQQEKKIFYVEIGIEPEGHAGNEDAGRFPEPEMVQEIPSAERQRKKYENEYIRIEKHEASIARGNYML